MPEDAWDPVRLAIARIVEQKEELRAYLDLVFDAGDSGYVHCPRKKPGTHWKEKSFHWPDQRAQVVEWLLQSDRDGFDTYIDPYVLSGKTRKKERAVRIQLVHADVDDGKYDPALVQALGGFAVASGTPGHAHVYVKLSRPVTTAEHTELCRALGTYLGAKDHKIRDNDVLRPPGTTNFKNRRRPRPVRLLPHGELILHDPVELATLLGASPTLDAKPPTSDETRTYIDTQVGAGGHRRRSLLTNPGQLISPEYLKILADGSLEHPRGGKYKSRSHAIQGVALHARNRGLSYEEFRSLVLDPAHDSHRWRTPQRTMEKWIRRSWDKATALCQAKPPPVGSKAQAIAMIEQLQHEAERPWPGSSGSTQREVIKEIHDIALVRGRIEFDLSVRELASRTGRSLAAVSGALHELVDQGWLIRVRVGTVKTGHATRYRLACPQVRLPERMLSPSVRMPMHDYWAAHAPSAKHIFEVLRAAPQTTADLMARTGKTRQTVNRHLLELEKDGLVTRGRAGEWTAVDVADDALDVLAATYGYGGLLLHHEKKLRWSPELHAPRRVGARGDP